MKTITSEQIGNSINKTRLKFGDDFELARNEPVKITGKYIESELLLDEKSNGIPMKVKSLVTPNLVLDSTTLMSSSFEDVNASNSFMISDSWIEGSSFEKVQADELVIEGSKLFRTNLIDIESSDIFIDKTHFEESEIISGDFSKSYWDDVKFQDGTIAYTNIDQSNFADVVFQQTDFNEVDFRKIESLKNVQFKECRFVDCELDMDKMIELGASFDNESSKSIAKMQGLQVSAELEIAKQQAKGERFLRLLAQTSIFQEVPYNGADIDVLRATFELEAKYNVVFGLNSTDQIYNATYQGGDLIKLEPQNEDLFYELNRDHSHPVNIITDRDKSYILAISNDFTKKMEKFEIIKIELEKGKYNFFQTFEEKLNKVFEKDSPIKRLEGINNLREEAASTLGKFQILKELHAEIRPTLTKIMEQNLYREELQKDMERIYRPYKKSNFLHNSTLSMFREFDSLASNIGNLELQNIRNEKLEGQLFSSPEQAVIFSRFDANKPFDTKINNEIGHYEGAASYFNKLVQHQVSEPEKIVKHYLSIRDSIDKYANKSYQFLDTTTLTKYAKQSLQHSVQIVESEIAKVNPLYQAKGIKLENPKQDSKLSIDSVAYWELAESREKAETLKSIYNSKPEEYLKVLNKINLSPEEYKELNEQLEMKENEKINTAEVKKERELVEIER